MPASELSPSNNPVVTGSHDTLAMGAANAVDASQFAGNLTDADWQSLRKAYGLLFEAAGSPDSPEGYDLALVGTAKVVRDAVEARRGSEFVARAEAWVEE